LLGKFNGMADPEWASIHRRVFAEARTLDLALPAADLIRCCDILSAADGADPEAAGAYDHLALTSREAVQPLHAWLYCRAAQEHGFRGKADLDLFALAFRDAAGAQKLYAQKGWDLHDVEATYLARWAEQHPGSFPDVFGPDYPPQGERLLLNRSQQQEAAGQLDAAVATTVTHVRLAPRSPRAYDRWACLEFRKGDLDQAVQVLTDWQGMHPTDPWPHLRRAAVEQRRGNAEACYRALDQALALTHGKFRADVAFLGARLALAHPPAPSENDGAERPALALGASSTPTALKYLEVCLHERPDHAAALWLRAALRWLSGDAPGLASLAPVMNRADAKDARYHYLAGVAQLAAGNPVRALEAAQGAAATESFAVESRYLGAIAHLGQNDAAAAIAELEPVALAAASPSVQHARALLGQAHFQTGNYTEAVRWWKQLDAGRRTGWQLDEPQRACLFLAGLQAYHAGQFEQAAERYREAGKQGYRDRRLGPLLQAALFKAGQRILYASHVSDNGSDFGIMEKQQAETAAQWLNQALTVGCKDPNAAYLLALAYKKQGKTGDARTALRKIADPDSSVWLQMGLLSLRDRQPEQAEQEFVKAWELDARSFAVGANLLLTRLSLGQTEWAASMAPQVAELAETAADRRLFEVLQALLWAVQSGNGERRPHAALGELSDEDEVMLLNLLCRLGHLDTICLLLRTLEAARPNSPRVREAHFEAVLLKGRKLVDRCDWDTAERLLTVLARQREVSPPTLAALLNLLGCCGCLAQNLSEGERYFSAASRLAGTDATIQQNLALVYEWQKDLPKAEPHWSRFFDLLERRKQQAPARADYFTRLTFEGLHRLAGLYSEKEKWGNALNHIERAQRVKPDDTETLERMFHLYAQVRRHADARRALQQLRYLKPGEAQYELYELDLVELREIDDIDRWIADIGRIVQRHPSEPRCEERAVTMVGNVVPLLTRMSDQLTDQVNKVIRQVRSLQNYQVNWQAVHDVMRDLKREFQKLRKIVGKCQGVVTNPELRRVLRDLCAHIDRKIEFCREWQGN
jgi:tetratricopeptide (TPR) repeat protein